MIPATMGTPRSVDHAACTPALIKNGRSALVGCRKPSFLRLACMNRRGRGPRGVAAERRSSDADLLAHECDEVGGRTFFEREAEPGMA